MEPARLPGAAAPLAVGGHPRDRTPRCDLAAGGSAGCEQVRDRGRSAAVLGRRMVPAPQWTDPGDGRDPGLRETVRACLDSGVLRLRVDRGFLPAGGA